MGILKGNKTFYEYEMTDTITENIVNRLEYGLIEIGAFTNVAISGQMSDYAVLKLVKDESNGAYGRTYAGIGAGWIWQSGVSVPSGVDAPIIPSGIYINNTFYPTATTSGTYAHKIDFRHGAVIFNTPVLAGTVKCEYAAKDIGVYSTDSPKWKVVYGEYDKYFDGTSAVETNMSAAIKEKNVWLPSVFINVESHTLSPLQLGGGEIASYVVRYTVIGEKGFQRNRLIDIISNQYQTSYSVYNIKEAPASYGRNGTVASGALPYEQLATENSPYFLTYAYVTSSQSKKIDDIADLYIGEVTQGVDVARYLSTY